MTLARARCAVAVAVMACLSACQSGDSGGNGQTRPVSHWLEQIETGDPEAKAAAVRELGQLGPGAGQALSKLVELLEDRRPEIRRLSAEAIGSIGFSRSPSPQEIETLRRAAEAEEPAVRQIAVQVLGKSAGPEVLPILIDGLADADETVRRGAVEALDSFPWEEGQPLGEDLAESVCELLASSDAVVRRAAAKLAARMPTDKVLPALLEAMAGSPPEISQEAAALLESLPPPTELPEKSLPLLLEATNAESAEVRRVVVRLLGHGAARQDVVAALVEALRDPSTEVRDEAAGALDRERFAEVTLEEELPGLLEVLKSDVESVRRVAALRIGHYLKAGRPADERIMPALLTVLTDSVREVRIAVIEALAASGSAEIVPALIDALASENRRHRIDMKELDQLSARYEAMESARDPLSSGPLGGSFNPVPRQRLERFKEHRQETGAIMRALESLGPGASSALVEGLGDEDLEVRVSCAGVLGENAPQEAKPLLLKLLSEERADAKKNAAVALGPLGGDDVVDALMKLLDDEDIYVRSAVVRALGKTGTDRADAVARLIEAFEDPHIKRYSSLGYVDRPVANAAIVALGEIGPAALDRLLEAIDSPEEQTRYRAILALGSIREERAVAKLAELLDDPDPKARQAAALALSELGPDAKAAKDALIKATADQHRGGLDFFVVCWPANQAAMLALGKMQEVEAVPRLIEILRTGSGEDQTIAARALGMIGPPAADAVEPLVELVRGDTYWPRREAIKTLGRIGPAAAAALPALVEFETRREEMDDLREERDLARHAIEQIRGDTELPPPSVP